VESTLTRKRKVYIIRESAMQVRVLFAPPKTFNNQNKRGKNMKGIPFIFGAWLPVVFNWWEGASEFAIAATIVVLLFAATKTIKLI